MKKKILITIFLLQLFSGLTVLTTSILIEGQVIQMHPDLQPAMLSPETANRQDVLRLLLSIPTSAAVAIIILSLVGILCAGSLPRKSTA